MDASGAPCPQPKHASHLPTRLPRLRSAPPINTSKARRRLPPRLLATTHGDLAERLAELEEKTEALAMSHDTFSRNTRNQLKQVFDALRELMTPPEPAKRPIGFINPEDKGKKGAAAKRKT